jgi:hypothetical protein
MADGHADPMIDVAQAVSGLFGVIGFAFVEDQHIEVLAATLRAFFRSADIPIHEDRAAAYYGGLQRPGERHRSGTGS